MLTVTLTSQCTFTLTFIPVSSHYLLHRLTYDDSNVYMNAYMYMHTYDYVTLTFIITLPLPRRFGILEQVFISKL